MVRSGLATVAVLLAVRAWCWGPEAHELITRQASAMLPAEIRTFYQSNSHCLVAMSSLPDHWREWHSAEVGPEHYIDLDLLGKPPFADLIADRKSAEQRFGKQKLLEAGVLPWAIVERYNNLVEAMKKLDAVGIVVQSAVLAHYVGDAHVPFHATKDYDGKTAGQKGIHFRWEAGLVALMLPENVRPREPEAVTDVLKSAFNWCIASFKLVDGILAADDKARAIDPNHAYKYYKALADDTDSILVGRLESASEALAGLWVAAWKETGKPALPAKHAPLFYGL